MNKKKTGLGAILPRIIVAVLLLSVIAVVFAGCGSNTAIDTSTDAAGWKDKTVELAPSTGFIDKLLSYIGTFLNWITYIMPANSYILTLFVFAIILEIIMLPFSIKQQKNSIRQAKLRPKEMAIRKKYAGRNDQATQQKVTQEIQELYQKENFNPMSGCLPLLVQLPIIIVLYWIVIDPIQYVCHMSSDLTSVLHTFITSPAADGGLGMSLTSTNGSIEILSKIQELSLEELGGLRTFCANGGEVFEKVCEIRDFPANFNIGPVNFGLIPGFNFKDAINYLLLLVPVLTFLSYFFSMKLNRRFSYQAAQNADDRQTACSNKMMDITMPLMSVWITFMVPAAVGVYWIFKSILGVVKQFIMSKVMPLPQFTEEDYKAAEKELFGKQPKKIQKSENVGKVRSLHHIDDDDYDENGNYIPPKPEVSDPESSEGSEDPTEKSGGAAELPENSMTEGATLKDDSDRVERARGILKKRQDRKNNKE